jgi:hypothetical protein
MHYSLKRKILVLDSSKSIVEQDITSVKAEKMVVPEVKKEECAPDDYHCIMNVPPVVDPGSSSWLLAPKKTHLD